jgi:formylglycine-generating enzyme required for sulfatase activity
MGCVSGIKCKDDETPVHEVCVGGFWMGKYEVTQAQWQNVMGDNPSHFTKDKVGQDTSTHPVEQVSWEDVQEFLQQLNEKAGTDVYRLPTEAEWEYVARAGTETMYSFGNDVEKLVEYAWYIINSKFSSHPVGQLKPNVWGLHDMHGNVWEWCQDWYDREYYSKSPSKNPGGPSSGSDRVMRGGYLSSGAGDCRAAFRDGLTPDSHNHSVGFRLVRTAS